MNKVCWKLEVFENELNYTIKEKWADKDKYVISHDEFDLDCRMVRTLHAALYDSQNRVIDSSNRSYADFEDIIPGSNGEAVYDAVVLLKETRENARRL